MKEDIKRTQPHQTPRKLPLCEQPATPTTIAPFHVDGTSPANCAMTTGSCSPRDVLAVLFVVMHKAVPKWPSAPHRTPPGFSSGVVLLTTAFQRAGCLLKVSFN